LTLSGQRPARPAGGQADPLPAWPAAGPTGMPRRARLAALRTE